MEPTAFPTKKYEFIQRHKYTLVRQTGELNFFGASAIQPGRPMQIKVYHRGYGCESGCCGHAIELDGKEVLFDFSHPYDDDVKEWAIQFVKDYLTKKHPQCLETIDWESIDLTEVSNGDYC